MMAAVEKLLQARAAANVECAYSFRRIKFVARKREEIDAERFYLERNFSRGLDCIGVEVDIALRGKFSDFCERLHGAEFVVRVHDGNERGVWAKRFLDLLHGDKTLAIHGKIGDGDAFFFQSLASVENGFVLDVRCDDVLGSAGRRANDTEDGVIIGFGAAAGEDDFLGSGAEKGSDLITGGFDGGAGTLADRMDAGSVAEFGGEVRKHRIEDLRLDGRCGVVIEIDAIHEASLSVERRRSMVNETEFC